MERIKRNFNRISASKPSQSSIVSFFSTCIENKYSMKEVTDGFNNLVDKKDYSRSDYDDLLQQCVNLAK
jgi:hypothetical protein